MEIIATIRRTILYYQVDDGSLNTKLHKLIDELEEDLDGQNYEPLTSVEDLSDNLNVYLDAKDVEDNRLAGEDEDNKEDDEDKNEDYIRSRNEDDENDELDDEEDDLDDELDEKES